MALELERKEPADSITVVYSEHDDESGIFCPHCGIEQVEHPINILMGTDGCNEWDCDECEKKFELMSTTFIEYVTTK
jgi:hypothetical protein